MQKRVRKRIKYKNPVVLAEMINGYFDECDALETPYTLSGLCLSVGRRRKDFLDESGDTELDDVLTQARLLIEQRLETRLYTETRTSGIIFALKNFGWTDKKELDIGATEGNVAKYTIEVVKPDGSKKEIDDDQISDTGKVVPFGPKTKAV